MLEEIITEEEKAIINAWGKLGINIGLFVQDNFFIINYVYKKRYIAELKFTIDEIKKLIENKKGNLEIENNPFRKAYIEYEKNHENLFIEHMRKMPKEVGLKLQY